MSEISKLRAISSLLLSQPCIDAAQLNRTGGSDATYSDEAVARSI